MVRCVGYRVGGTVGLAMLDNFAEGTLVGDRETLTLGDSEEGLALEGF